MGRVTMNATRINMINLLKLWGHGKRELNKLSDEELQQLGIKDGAWVSLDYSDE